jgi:hypothetical protein
MSINIFRKKYYYITIENIENKQCVLYFTYKKMKCYPDKAAATGYTTPPKGGVVRESVILRNYTVGSTLTSGELSDSTASSFAAFSALAFLVLFATFVTSF